MIEPIASSVLYLYISPTLSLSHCTKSKKAAKAQAIFYPFFSSALLFLRNQTHKEENPERKRKKQRTSIGSALGKVEVFKAKKGEMGDKDDGLGLSLSLGCAQNQPSLKLNLMPLALPSMQNLQQRNIWNELFQSSDGQLETRSVAGGIDVNQAPALAECEEDGVSSPNSTVSSIGGKRNGRDPVCDETEAERPSCSRSSDDEDGGGAGDDASRKKLRLSKEQSLVLEETFKEHSTLNPKQKLALAMQLKLRPRQVEVWFQNRRARTRLKQTEVDCEYLKRCCDNLTEENRRLQKEVQELRALKLSPQLYTHINPPTTLTMCPSCERVAVASSSSSSLAASSAPNSKHQRPVPASSWAALPLPVTHRPFNAPASRP